MPRVYTYLRSAIEEPDTDANPRAALDGWLARYADHQLRGAYQDRGVSGLTPPEQRPGFKALLTAVSQETGDLVLLVPAFHHVSRRAGVLQEVRRKLALCGVRLLTSESPPDDGLGEQRLVEGVLSAIQDYHRSLRRSRRRARA